MQVVLLWASLPGSARFFLKRELWVPGWALPHAEVASFLPLLAQVVLAGLGSYLTAPTVPPPTKIVLQIRSETPTPFHLHAYCRLALVQPLRGPWKEVTAGLTRTWSSLSLEPCPQVLCGPRKAGPLSGPPGF